MFRLCQLVDPKVKQVQNTLPSPRRRASGFTLIEVMIVVAIIGILAAVALPAYNDYVRRGQLPEAFTELSGYRGRMEQYYQDNRNYGTAAACAPNATAGSWNTFTPVPPGRFTYGCATSNVTAGGAQAYTITATGASGQAIGHVYTIDQEGRRATTTFKGATVTGMTCWLTKAASC
jgi:type IV pilus assembly protein PilE